MQVFFEHLQRHDIQIVRRLVQHQEVRIAHQYRAQVEPAPFPAAELPHEVVLRLRREKKMLQELRRAEAPSVPELDLLGDLTDDIDHFRVLVEREPLLRIIAEADRLADVDRSRVGRLQPQQHPDESRLARAVVADDAHFLVASETVVQSVEDDPVAEPLA